MSVGWRVRAVCALGALAGPALGPSVPACAAVTSVAYQSTPPRAAQFSAYLRHSAYAPMTDGVRLAVTWYQPSGEGPSKFPVLLWYLPGHRESIRPDTGQISPAMDPDDIAFFTGRGYVVAVAEMRGSGASFGSRAIDRGPQIGRDGKDLVDWLAARDWSDGRVGMIGLSYQGFSQYATAANRPRALRAIFPEIAGYDDYTSMFYPGGIFVEALSKFAAANIARDDRNEFAPDESIPKMPSVPVLDENGDGQLQDEIPLDLNGNGRFDDEPVPRYATPGRRPGLYDQATREHLKNLNLSVQDLKQAPYRDSPIAGTPHTYIDLDPGLKPGVISHSGIAVYSRGGWFDYHARDSVMWFATLVGHTPAYLMMAPTGHSALPRARQAQAGDHMTPATGGPYFKYFNDPSTNDLINAEKLRFFDRYVRDIDNGLDREPPVLLFVMGRGWRREQEWPLRRAMALRLSFTSGQGLEIGTTSPGVDEYAADLHTSSISEGANRWNYGIARASHPMTLDRSPHARLAYTSAPLSEDREVTGHPRVELALSSSAAEGDVFAYLEDVAPDGSSLLVTEGQLRANYHANRPSQSILPPPASIAIKPRLPWHGYARADYRPRPFADRRVVKLTFDLQPTAWVFSQGHRIRVSLAAADWPSFALHPLLSPKNDPEAADTVRPTWQVHRGPGLSALILPTIP